MEVALLKQNLGKLGGLEKSAWSLARAFVKKGHSVTFLCCGSISEKLPDGIQAVSLTSKRKWNYSTLKNYNKALKQHLLKHSYPILFGLERHYTQTHYRAGNGCHAAYLDMRKTNANALKSLSFTLNPFHRYILELEKYTYTDPNLKRLYVNSHYVKSQIIHYYPEVENKKIKVIHNGIEWLELEDTFKRWPEEYDTLLKKRELLKQPLQLLFVGNGYERKGLELLIRALQPLKGKNWVLWVVGKDRNPNYFKSLSISAGLDNQIFFEGSQSDLTPYYLASDFMILPTLYDPFANTTLEALALGVPVMTSSSNGGHEILNNFSGRVITQNSSPQKWTDELDSILDHFKTKERSKQIRESVSHLEKEGLMSEVVEDTLSTLTIN